jgi:hypothetical protein
MAPSWKDIQSEDEISELTVTLRNHLGIRPQVYVPLIWGVILVAVLLSVLVIPGVRHPGEEVTITSVPEGAQIEVDDQHRGTTPATIFMAEGMHDIVITAGTAAKRVEAEIGRRVVGSLLFPKRRTYNVVLDDPEIETAIQSGVAEFARWSLMGEPSAQFQYAPVGHDTARRLWASEEIRNGSPHGRNELNRFRRDLVSHAAQWQTRDLMAATMRVAAPGALPTPGSISETVQYFIQLDNDSTSFARLVWDLTPADEVFRAPLTDTAWAERRIDELSTALLAGSLAPDERAIPVARVIELQGIRFSRVPAGSYILGYPLRDESDQGVPVSFPQAFWIQDRELTRGDFARFVRQEPHWAPENRSQLVAEELVQSEYLSDWPPEWDTAFATGSAGSEPLRYVSWYALDAYVSWLNEVSTGTAPGMDGSRFVLPSAAHWEYGAFLNGLGGPSVVSDGGGPEPVRDRSPGALDIYDLEGNLWEWTSDWHAHHYRTFPPTAGDQRIVAGGSFATGETGHNLMGAQPPNWTTPFLGGRLALVPEEREMDTNGR